MTLLPFLATMDITHNLLQRPVVVVRFSARRIHAPMRLSELLLKGGDLWKESKTRHKSAKPLLYRRIDRGPLQQPNQKQLHTTNFLLQQYG